MQLCHIRRYADYSVIVAFLVMSTVSLGVAEEFGTLTGILSADSGQLIFNGERIKPPTFTGKKPARIIGLESAGRIVHLH